jgi:hypothetical protein
MSIKKLINKIDENIISGIEKRVEFSFSFWSPPPFLSLSFYLIGNPNPHIPPIRLYSPKKYKNSPF